MRPPLLYLIADLRQGRHVASICDAVRAGHDARTLRLAFQLRDKQASAAALCEACRAWVKTAHARDAQVFMNERSDVALAAGADGVHLSNESYSLSDAARLPGNLQLAYSAHDTEEAAAALQKADFVTLSPIFESPGKTPPIGLAPLERAACAKKQGDLLALGGITETHVPEVLRAGADGIALIGAVFGAANPARAAAGLAAALVKNWRA